MGNGKPSYHIFWRQYPFFSGNADKEQIQPGPHPPGSSYLLKTMVSFKPCILSYRSILIDTNICIKGYIPQFMIGYYHNTVC